MAYFYNSIDKEAVRAFIYEDLKILGIKIPKLEKIAKAGRNSLVQQRSDGSTVFGVPLALLESSEDPNIGPIPQFLRHSRHFLSSHLHKEGIFRKTGSVARQKDLLRHFEAHGGAHIEDAQVYDVTGVIKHFFRTLPEPLIPHILQDAFIQAVSMSTSDSRAYSLTLLSLLMPTEHLAVFRYLLEILADVAQCSKENRMDAHNLSVCLSPNLFQTKQNCKVIHQQTSAVEICIQNVLNIGVIPPSITEKVVMLRSLEAHDSAGAGNSSMETSSNTTGSLSLRKKKRSGSLQGFVGSIRRSVERLRSRATRRSASVPDNLNILDDSDDFGFRPVSAGPDDSGSAGQVTPQIIRRRGDQSQENVSQSHHQQQGLSNNKRRAIINQSGLLGTPLMKINPKCQSTDAVFDSPTRSTHSGDQTSVSLDSSRNNPDGSRVSTPSKRKMWGGLRSPFSRRKRSMSAGPSYSPGGGASGGKHSRTSSKTKKLIRRLSGGKNKTPDMVGQRLAFNNDDTDCLVRQRLPSAPTAHCLNNQSTTDAADSNGGSTNEDMMRSLKSGMSQHQSDGVSGNGAGGDGDMVHTNYTAEAVQSSTRVSRLHTMRASRREQQVSLRRRAKSADSRPLKRGRPNHLTTGLNRVNVQQQQRDSLSSVNSLQSNDSLGLISKPMNAESIMTNRNMELINLSAAKLRQADQLRPPSTSTDQSQDCVADLDSHLRFSSHSQDSMDTDEHSSRRGSQSSGMTSADDSFDSRLGMVARRHSNLYADPISLTDQSRHSINGDDHLHQRYSDQSHSGEDKTDQSVPRQHSAMTVQAEHELSNSERGLVKRSATFTSVRGQPDSNRGHRSSHKDSRPPRSDARPPRPVKSSAARQLPTSGSADPPRTDSPTAVLQNRGNNSSIAFNKSDASIVTVVESPHKKRAVMSSSLASALSGNSTHNLTHSDSGVSIGDQNKASKSSLLSTDSGIASDTSLNQQHRDVNVKEVETQLTNQRVVIGGNDGLPPPLPAKTSLSIRGAELQKITHADSLADLHTACKVSKHARALEHESSEESRERVTTRPPSHRKAPVRVPTVFAKNDPRGMKYKIAADAVRRRSQQREADSDDIIAGSPNISPIHSPTARLRISSPGRGSPGSPRSRQQHRLRANTSRNSSTRTAASAALARSLKTSYSPPPRKTAAVSLRQQRQYREVTERSTTRRAAAPHIPISTDLVRGIITTETGQDSRSALRETSQNVKHSATTTPPRIKQAMLPMRAGGLPPHPSRKSPRSHSTSAHRLTPYSTRSPNKHPSSSRQYRGNKEDV